MSTPCSRMQAANFVAASWNSWRCCGVMLPNASCWYLRHFSIAVRSFGVTRTSVRRPPSLVLMSTPFSRRHCSRRSRAFSAFASASAAVALSSALPHAERLIATPASASSPIALPSRMVFWLTSVLRFALVARALRAPAVGRIKHEERKLRVRFCEELRKARLKRQEADGCASSRSAASPVASAGSVKTKRDPPPAPSSTAILPPCVSATWRTIARPSPEPGRPRAVAPR